MNTMKKQNIKELFEQYLPMIRARCREAAAKYGLEYGDLLSTAWEGFLKAHKTFDSKKGAFPAWLDNNIKWALQAYARKEHQHSEPIALVIEGALDKLPDLESEDDTNPLSEQYLDCDLFGVKQIVQHLHWGDKYYAAKLVKTNTSSTWHFHTHTTLNGNGVEYFTHTNSVAAGVAVYRARATANQSRAGRENLAGHNIVWTNVSSGSGR